MTTIAAVIVICIGSIGVYAASGGTIAGKPIIEWLGITFSEEYENYKVNVEGQELTSEDATIHLTSTVCDDGFTILEFDIKLMEERDDIDSVYVSFNNKLITDEMGTYLEGLNNYSLIIDGKDYWIRPQSAQTITKISNTQYKLYQMYFLTDKELGAKQEFTITLRDVVIEITDTQEEPVTQYLPFDGQFDIKVSKEKAVENTKIIVPECEEIQYKDMTKKVEKVMITPLQTIVKLSTIYEDVSLDKLTNTENVNHINIIEYEAYDEDGKSLNVCSYETQRIVTYADGRVEEWEQGDIGTSKKFTHGKMELTEYVIIEKHEENPNLKLTLKERIETRGEREYITIGNFNLHLKDDNTTNDGSNENIENDGTFIIKKIKNEEYMQNYKAVEVPNAAKDCISIKEDDDHLMLHLIQSDTNEYLLEGENGVAYDKEYQISNITAENVKSIFYGVQGQDIGYPLVFIIQKDNTVKGIDIEYGYRTGNFISMELSELTNIDKFEQADVTPPNDSGYMAVVAITKDGEIYEVQRNP